MCKVVKVTVGVLEGVVPGLLLLGVVLLVCVDVAARYAANAPIRGVSEIALVATVWVVMLGSGHAMGIYQHISVTALVDSLDGRLKSVVQLFSLLIVAAVLAFILWTAVPYVADTAARRFSITGLSRAWITSAVPVGLGLVALHAAEDMVRLVRDIRTGGQTYWQRRAQFSSEQIHDPGPLDSARAAVKPR